MNRMTDDEERAERAIDDSFVAWCGELVADEMERGRRKGWRRWHDPKVCTTEKLAIMSKEARRRGDIASAATFLLMVEWRDRQETD